jgi:Prokaryotic dksA/traR C4-type zinc finger
LPRNPMSVGWPAFSGRIMGMRTQPTGQMPQPPPQCHRCGKPIPAGRLEALPGVRTCLACSDARPKVGVMVWDKTTSELLLTDAAGAERLRRLERSDGRLGRLK